jgi:endonuclease YncB( thermonuclease family)
MKALMLLCSLVTVIPAATLKGKVVGIKTGSSLEILSGGKVMDLQLQGIECARKGHSIGKAARHFVADNAFMKEVSVEITGTESNGTLIGKLKLADGRDLGAELTKLGLAWWDKRNDPDAAGMAKLETEARSASLGIWAAASEDDEDEDIGREVLVLRELAGKNADALLTRADIERP